MRNGFTILYSYLPKELMVISSFFGLWTFWVQIFGLFNVVGRLISPWKVLLSYVLSLLSFLVVLMLISSIFMIAGQMDTKELETKMQQIMQEQQQLQQQPSK